ncbi:MAG: ATP-binding cassette domain-containing protein, partial [Planctomycetes bacterium]|nr:ATP-binding cassette domain-containing protein [Planctomycetota bacterium]
MTQENAAVFIEPKRPIFRLFKYMKPYKGRFLFASGSSVANKILDLYPPILVGWVIDTVNRKTPAFIENFVTVEQPVDAALFLSFLVVLIFGLESLFQWMFQFGFMTLSQKVQHDLRVDTYEHLQRREIAFFEDHRMGETMAMLNDDVNQLERFLNTGFNELLQLLTLFCFAGYILFSTSWELALLGMWPILLIVWGSLLYQKVIAPRYRRVREAVGRLSSRLENNLAGILVIKAFTAEKFERQRVEAESAEYRDANYRAIKLAAVYVPLIRMGVALGFACVLYYGAQWCLEDNGKITVGGLVLFSMMIQRLLWPLTRLGATLDEYERAKASARRTFGVLDTPAAIQDPATPVEISTLKGEIAFNDVKFRYARGVDVLKGLNFTIKPGETVGFAGTTGAGKSTMVKLLLRLYDVSGGSLTIDGVDVRQMRMRDLRRHIALVSQDVYLFHGTIGENIAYGAADASPERIAEAARLAAADKFIARLPGGYDFRVGPRGSQLSGGQRQR